MTQMRFSAKRSLLFTHLARPQWIGIAMAAAIFVGALAWHQARPFAQTTGRFGGPTSSQPLALTANGQFLVVANPDNNSVSIFDVLADRNQKIGEVAVGQEPNGIAITPNGSHVYVANTVDGTVSVLDISAGVQKVIPVGTEPYGLAMTPNGTKLYVSNARSNTVSVIDTATNVVMRTIPNVGFEPRGIAITNDGDGDDEDETVYVTQFLALSVPGEVDGEDNDKVGLVTVINSDNDHVINVITINPLADTGFLAAGDAIARIAPAPTPAFTFPTGAYPNQLNNIAIKRNRAYLPSIGASPNGPVRFNVNVQGLLSVIDDPAQKDTNRTINMNRAVAAQTGTPRRFFTNPWAIGFANTRDEGYIVSAASDIVQKVTLDSSTGAPSVVFDPSDLTRVLQIPTGKNPRGIVINSTDTRAYVFNYVSRDVSVINLNTDKNIATLPSASLPAPGTFPAFVHAGKELYNTSVGVFDPATPGGAPITGRMSAGAWGACASCHPNGLTDNVVWIFGSGPRRTISQHTDVDQTDPTRRRIRILNYSAVNDEIEDFESNIRGVSGGQGLIVLPDNVTPDPVLNSFNPANAGRNQLRINGFPALTAIRAFVEFGIRAPISPISDTAPQALAGRSVFIQAGCQQCHGGAQWTTALRDYTPPANAADIFNGQVFRFLKNVGTFDPSDQNEVRANATFPLGTLGYVPPSLLSVFMYPDTLLHNGAAENLEKVLDNATHRTAGNGAGGDPLEDDGKLDQLLRFLRSIDTSTPPIDPATPTGNF